MIRHNMKRIQSKLHRIGTYDVPNSQYSHLSQYSQRTQYSPRNQ